MVHVHAVTFSRELVWDPPAGPYRKGYADYTLEVVEAIDLSFQDMEALAYRAVWRDHSDWLNRSSEDTVEYSTYRDPFSLVVMKYAECRKRQSIVNNLSPQLRYY